MKKKSEILFSISMGNGNAKQLFETMTPFQNRKFLDELFNRKCNRVMSYGKCIGDLWHYGETSRNSFDGYATIFNSARVIKEGIFKNGTFVIGAIYDNDNGMVYYGEFCHRKLNGKGEVYEIRDGKETLRRKGKFVNGHQQDGIYVNENGECYSDYSTGEFWVTNKYKTSEMKTKICYGLFNNFDMLCGTYYSKGWRGFFRNGKLDGFGQDEKEQTGLFSNGKLIKHLNFGHNPHYMYIFYEDQRYKIAGTPQTKNIYIGIEDRIITDSSIPIDKLEPIELAMIVKFSERWLRKNICKKSIKKISDIYNSVREGNETFEIRSNPCYSSIKNLLQEGNTIPGYENTNEEEVGETEEGASAPILD